MTSVPPSSPQPPNSQIAALHDVIATILSSSKSSSGGNPNIALDDLRQRLQDLRYSTSAIDWSIFIGLKGGYFEVVPFLRKTQKRLSRHAVEIRPTEETVQGISATEIFWKRWREGELNAASVELEPIGSMALVLSGGGYRATMFHLGIFIYLNSKGMLNDVAGLISVSGGSITAAHFTRHWQKAVGSEEGFLTVAASLVEFMRGNLRDRVLSSWLWTLVLPWNLVFIRSWWNRRTQFLLRGYEKFFGSTTLGSLVGNQTPRLAIISTDSLRQERVAFTQDQLIRLPVVVGESQSTGPEIIVSNGVHIALAVTASSCFPPVFCRLTLGHSELGLNYSEFKETMFLNDGGVSGNLGVRALIGLQSLCKLTARRVIVCDAERPLNSKPRSTPLADSNAQAAALSQSERDEFKNYFKDRGIAIRYSDRLPDSCGFDFRVQTKISGYRTDLDQPSWHEVYAVVMHGYNCAAHSLATGEESADRDKGTELIYKLIGRAGGPKELTQPTEKTLASCGKRSYTGLVFQGLLVFLIVLAWIRGTIGLVAYLYRWLMS